MRCFPPRFAFLALRHRPPPYPPPAVAAAGAHRTLKNMAEEVRTFITAMCKDQENAFECLVGDDLKFDIGKFNAHWKTFFADDDVQMIRPSGNPLSKAEWATMFASEDVVIESDELVSIDSVRIFAGGNAAVATYSKHSKFIYKGDENDDYAVFSATLEKKGGDWKVVFVMRATGQPPK